MRVATTEQFIEKSKSIHGEAFDYSKTVYTGSKNKLTITCKKHGDFMAFPGNHYRGVICRKCHLESSWNGGRSKKSEVRIMNKIKSIHGDTYDYSKFKYKRGYKKSIVICKDHGEFSVTPSKHAAGSGCPECGKKSRATKDEFIEKSKLTHGETYSYSNVDYKGSNVKVEITCKKHGGFLQAPAQHIYGQGCPSCSYERRAEGRGIRIVYVMHRLRDGLTKIGISNNPERRLKSINGSFSGEFTIFSVTDCGDYIRAQVVEKLAHRKFKSKKYKGEKFNGHTECFFINPLIAKSFIESSLKIISDNFD